MKLRMKKQLTILLCIIFCVTVFTGCGSISEKTEEQSEQNQTVVEKVVTLEDCIPLENLLALNHRDGGNKFRYMDPIPEEYWNIEDKNGVKGIAASYEGEIYKLYRNGKIVDETGNVKHNTPDNSNNDVDVFTAWILGLREDDMLGRDVVYSHMTYDVEKVITYDELKNMLHVVYITTENFHDYFTFIDVEEQEEITKSSFEENYLYMPNISRRFAYKGPGYLMNAGSFEWQVDVRLSFDEKMIRTTTYTNSDEIYTNEIDFGHHAFETDIRCYEFDFVEEGEYRNVGCYTKFGSELLKYQTDYDKSYLAKTEYFYDNIEVEKAQGFFIYCDDIPEDRFNITEKGNRYVCVQRQDGSAWRFCEYGRIGSSATDVDAYLETEITPNLDGTPRQPRKDILSLNGNDLNNFIDINLDTILGQ